MAQARVPDPKQLFGQAVKRFRLERGLSQERLAELAGIHRNYAGEVERGERNVALLNMVRIAGALQVTLAQLVEPIDVKSDMDSGGASPATRNAPREKRGK